MLVRDCVKDNLLCHSQVGSWDKMASFWNSQKREMHLGVIPVIASCDEASITIWDNVFLSRLNPEILCISLEFNQVWHPVIHSRCPISLVILSCIDDERNSARMHADIKVEGEVNHFLVDVALVYSVTTLFEYWHLRAFIDMNSCVESIDLTRLRKKVPHYLLVWTPVVVKSSPVVTRQSTANLIDVSQLCSTSLSAFGPVG